MMGVDSILFVLGSILLVVSRSLFVDALAFAANPLPMLHLPTIESSIFLGGDGDGNGGGNDPKDDDDDDDWDALSSFGRKQYWDDVYNGVGDFPAEQYSWYYGYDEISRHIKQWFPNHKNNNNNNKSTDRLLLPGIGNDNLLLDLLKVGYRDITAQDYSRGALLRQMDLLTSGGWCSGGPAPAALGSSTATTTISSATAPRIVLSHSDVKNLPFADGTFDGIIEKGLLDAVYLSDQTSDNLRLAVQSLTRCLKPGGILLSVSGVVPPAVRANVFNTDDYEWRRDGTNDLRAGCFIVQKRM
jgi:SAM-dependent methyltransferase